MACCFLGTAILSGEVESQCSFNLNYQASEDELGFHVLLGHLCFTFSEPSCLFVSLDLLSIGAVGLNEDALSPPPAHKFEYLVRREWRCLKDQEVWSCYRKCVTGTGL